jgi:hypothetical protein
MPIFDKLPYSLRSQGDNLETGLNQSCLILKVFGRSFLLTKVPKYLKQLNEAILFY